MKHDAKYMAWAQEKACLSEDPSTKVGAAIRIEAGGGAWAGGYNRMPKGTLDTPFFYKDRDRKYPRVLHAEMVALLNILQAKQPIEGSTLYCTVPPCSRCAGMLIEAGIARVVHGNGLPKDQIALDMFAEAGVEVEEWK